MPPPPRLIFPVASTKVGKPYAIAEYCVVDPDIACRELIQNALDAHALVTGGEPCRVIFKVAKLKTTEIPGYEEYRKALNKSQASWDGNESVTSYLASIREYLDQDELAVLYVMDNGKGFDEKGLEAVIAEGAPDKQDGSTGSFGIGHLTTYGISGLQYVCYASKRLGGDLLATGHAILSSHDSDGKLCSNNGYYVSKYEPKFNDPFTFCGPGHIPDFLRAELEMIKDTGSVVAILGFNGFRRDLEDDGGRQKELPELLREAIAENFAIAVLSDALEIEVHGLGGEEGNGVKKIDKNSIEGFLEWMARPETGTKAQTKKARQTLEAMETFRKPSVRENLTGRFRDCEIFLRGDGVAAHTVSVWRNGLLITRTHRGLAANFFCDKKPLDAVIRLSGQDTYRHAHDLVKSAETPLHDKIQSARLPSSSEKQELQEFLKEIRSWINEHAEDAGGEAADLEDEVLLEGNSTGEFKISRQIKLFPDYAEEDGGVEVEVYKPDGPPNETDDPHNRKNAVKEVRPRNFTDAQVQGKALGQNGSSDYRIRVRPAENIENGVLKVIVDSGQDISCAGVIQDAMLAVKSAAKPDGGEKFQVSDGLVKLASVKKDHAIVLDLTFVECPDDFSRVSLGCLLGVLEDKE